MEWMDKIDCDNPSWADIARLLDAGTIRNDDKREEMAHYGWISGLIKKKGPMWVYQNRRGLKKHYTSFLRLRWKEKWAEEDREQRRKAGRMKRK
jgi:hypothetical protein